MKEVENVPPAETKRIIHTKDGFKRETHAKIERTRIPDAVINKSLE
jgi:hypothetical protein